MFKNLFNAFKIKDVRRKLLLTLLLLFIYRLGCWLPIPGFNISQVLEQENNLSNGFSIFGIMNMISGNALQNCSVLALGVSPYITASIVIQLLSMAIPALERLSKDGENGRKKINMFIRIAALVLSLAQAIGIVVGYKQALDVNNALWVGAPEWLIGTGVVLILVAGGMFTVWLGERITDLGVANGMSMLIFVGILASSANSIFQAIKLAINDVTTIWTIVLYLVALVLIFGLIVFMDSAERRVTVQYAKQIRGRKMYGGQSNCIPMKLTATGVMPIIFASALLAFPQIIISIFWPENTWYQQYMGTNSWLYIVLLALFIFVFTFFYSKMTFDADDVSKRLQQQGGFIQGIRPGKQTADYLKRISNRITLFGAIFLAFVALIPSLAFKAIGDSVSWGVLINAFSATGLIILVSVALEFDKQLEAQMLMRTYKGFLN